MINRGKSRPDRGKSRPDRGNSMCKGPVAEAAECI